MKQSKYSARIIQLLALAVLAGLSVYTAMNTGILSNLGQEDIYWERARFLLGQGGASNYNGSSLCSLGYSLVLVPICAVLKSPYAAYKAAILLNGCFLCVSYLVSLKTARKLFSGENQAFLSAACFFAAVCPVLAASRSFTGPEMLLVLLVWISLYLLLSLREKYSTGKLAALAGCMILAGFLQIAFLGVIVAVVILLGIYLKEKKIEETSFLYFCLAVLVGLALGNIAERSFLYSFAEDMNLTVKSSLELFLDGIMAGWENNYFLGIFRGLCGKLFALMTGSFLLLAPGIWHCVKGLFLSQSTKQDRKRQVFCPEVFQILAIGLLAIALYENFRSTTAVLSSVNYVEAALLLLLAPAIWRCVKELFLTERTEQDKGRQIFCPEIFLIFAIELLVIVLYDNSRSTATALTSVNYVETVLPPMILLGAVQIKKSTCWEKELTGYLLTLCICAFVTANLYQTQGISSISSSNNGILMLFQNQGMTPVALVYGSACLVILAAILISFCVKSTLKWRKMNWILRAAGFLCLGGLYLVPGLMVCGQTAVASNENIVRSIAPLASLLTETGASGEYYYLMGTGSDSHISMLQSLMPDYLIYQEKNNGKERALFYEDVRQGEISPGVIITGTGDSLIQETMPEELPEYRLLYMTSSYALWAERGSETEQSLETVISSRLEYLELRSVTERSAVLLSDAETADENAQTEGMTEGDGEADSLLLEPETEEGAEDVLAEEETELQSEGETELQSEEETETEENAEELDETEEASEGESEEVTEEESETEKENWLSDKKKVYGGGAYLVPGTYRMEIYFTKGDVDSELSGQIRLRDSEGTIITQNVDEGIFADGHTGAVVVEFTDREVMRNLQVVISGTFAGHTEITDIYYWKTSSAYTVGLNGTNATEAPCEAILAVEELCQEPGTIAYVGDVMVDHSDLSARCFESDLPGYTVEVISKEESETTAATYLIGPTPSHSYYYAMEEYSVIDKTRYYTVLVRNDSEQYEKFLEEGGVLLSEGRSFISDAFTKEDTAAGPIALDAGSYIFHGEIRGTVPVGTIVQLKNGETVIEEQEINADTVEIAFAIPKRCTGLSCVAVTEEGEELDVRDWSIELTSEKYQFGQEEEELDELSRIINDLGKGVTVAAVQELEVIREEDIQYDYLQEQLPGAYVEARSYAEANNAVDDPLLLTCGLSENDLRLLGKYCILGHAGEYTLWARCEGGNVQKAIENGVEVLSSGKKISPKSIMAMTGMEDETEAIAELPEVVYNVYLELDVSDIEKDDTIEIMLLCDKSEEEIEDEIQNLKKAGYTRKAAEKEVDEQIILGTATYEAYGLDGEKEMVYAIQTNQGRELLNFTADVYTWTAGVVESEIVWVEIA